MSIDLVVAIIGSMVGWFSLFPRRIQLELGTSEEHSLSIIIPARNEETNVGELIKSVRNAIGPSVEIIVVDDQSVDATAKHAVDYGARLVRIDHLPDGWTGKSHACWSGQVNARGEFLMFVDADVRLGDESRSLLRSAMSTITKEPRALVSVQPWHRPGRFVEHFAMLFNVVSVMASRCRGVWASERPLVFGPLVMCRAAEYRALGGHSHVSVRGSVVEDISLGQLFARNVVVVGRKDAVTFRMYETGLSALFEGFAKNLASAGSTVSATAVVGVCAWFVFLCSPLAVGLVMYPACALQVYLSAKVVGRFSILHALIYPVHVAFFVVVLIASMWRRYVIGSAPWKGRTVEL